MEVCLSTLYILAIKVEVGNISLSLGVVTILWEHHHKPNCLTTKIFSINNLICFNKTPRLNLRITESVNQTLLILPLTNSSKDQSNRFHPNIRTLALILHLSKI